MQVFKRFIYALYVGAITTQLGACVGPTEFGPAGGIIVPSKKNDRLICDKLTIYSEGGVASQLKIYCYRPNDSLPFLAWVGFNIKEFVFSRNDNGACQYIGVSQLEVTNEFNRAATELACKLSAQCEDAAKTEDAVECEDTAKTEDAAKTVPLSPTAKLRNSYAAALFNIEEYNCRSFLASSFTTRALSSTQKDFISTLGTGISTGTALSSPVASAAIGVTNLVYGSGVDSLNKNVYLEKTTEALSSAIQASRIANRNYILSNLNRQYEEYPIENVLSDIKAYESLCSVSAGAAELNRIAAQKLGIVGAAPDTQTLQKNQADHINLLTNYIDKMDEADKKKKSLEKEIEDLKIAINKTSLQSKKKELQKQIQKLTDSLSNVSVETDKDKKSQQDNVKAIKENATTLLQTGGDAQKPAATDSPLPIGASTNIIPSAGSSNSGK